MKNLNIFLIYFIFIMLNRLNAQEEQYIFTYPRTDMIDISLKFGLIEEDDGVIFKYDLYSYETSKQKIWTLRITYQGNSLINYLAPEGWMVRKPKDKDFISWGASDTINFIIPGSVLNNFEIVTDGLPSISNYYIQGYVPTPILDKEPDIIIGGSFLENSKKGKTIGPKDPPDPFVATAFLDELISYKHQSIELGWIDNQGIANSLDVKLDNAKKHIEKGQIKPAINMLNAFINEVEAQNGKHLTSEAYALLKYNAEYFIQKLEEE